ncbi:hypothetical protein Bbelb_376150 [Branchiostoma belcheri]|nr:hypothetical protein Bbelb_376150 [Branchiostoma belcheri]
MSARTSLTFQRRKRTGRKGLNGFGLGSSTVSLRVSKNVDLPQIILLSAASWVTSRGSIPWRAGVGLPRGGFYSMAVWGRVPIDSWRGMGRGFGVIVAVMPCKANRESPPEPESRARQHTVTPRPLDLGREREKLQQDQKCRE